MDAKKRQARNNTYALRVYCLPEESERIEKNARATGLSTSKYLLTVGQGYKVSGILDYQAVEELARINGDLGRLGGLLKLWLTDNVRAAGFGITTIQALMERIKQNQQQMREIMHTVMLPRTPVRCPKPTSEIEQ